jgi:putative phage-type endonuclease
MKIVRMVQGSPEWHEHRRKYRNASETSVVMSVSPFQTPYQLWQLKLGLIEHDVTPAMRHGSEMEPVARAAFERRTGLVIQPLVVIDGEYSASLDGMTLRGERVVEIKCPVKGRDSTLWKTVETGLLPEYYQLQVQHQLLVTNADVADVYVFDGTDGVLLEIAPQPETWPRIHEAWDRFMGFVAKSEPPPLTERDVRLRDDAEWAEAAQAYIEARRAADAVQKTLEDAKGRLIALTSHSSEAGRGVTVTRYWKLGSIDYKKVPELAGIDLEQYRGCEREETRVAVLR